MTFTASGLSGYLTVSLQPGNTGQNVIALQQWLVKNGLLTQAQMNSGVGVYGPATKAAVASLQVQLGVNAGADSGYYGPLTITAIQMSLAALNTPARPDLVINSFSPTITSLLAGQSTTVNFSVGNTGNVQSAATVAQIFLYTSTGSKIQQLGSNISIGAIAASGGSSGTKSLTVALPSTLAAGNYKIGVEVSAVSGEVVTGNNAYSAAFTITSSDLMVSSLTVGNSSVTAGGTTAINFAVQNIGNATATASTTAQLKLVRNSDGATVWSTTFTTGQLGVNASQPYSATLPSTLTSGLAAGAYSVVAVADTTNVLTGDPNRNNNTLSTSLTITKPLQSTASIFSSFGGELSTSARLASAAYFPANGDQNVKQSYDSVDKAIKWLSSSDLSNLAGVGTGGLYVNQNAAALVGRSADALFISFRGTDDAVDRSEWVYRQNYWQLFNQGTSPSTNFVLATDAYLTAHPEITKVYVTGHSLGGAMAEAYMSMSQHLSNKYAAITFASPGYNTDTKLAPDVVDDRIVNIWDDADPILLASALGQRNVRGDQIFVTSSSILRDFAASDRDLGSVNVSSVLAGNNVTGSLNNLIAAANDLIPDHSMSLYLSIVAGMDRARQALGVSDGWFISDNKADRTFAVLDSSFNVAGRPTTGPDTFQAAAGQTWVNSLAPNLVKGFSDYLVQQSPTGTSSGVLSSTAQNILSRVLASVG